MAAPERENRDRVHRVYGAFKDQYREIFAAVDADESVLRAEVNHCLDAIIDYRWEISEALPDAELTVEETIADGEKVAIGVSITGIHECVFRRIAPTLARQRYAPCNSSVSSIADGMTQSAQ